LNSDPVKVITIDISGEFWLKDIPICRQGILVGLIGNHSTTLKNLIVSSAKETVLYIELIEKVETTEDVTIMRNIRKDLTMRKMASVSARTFIFDEAGHYAGSREDVDIPNPNHFAASVTTGGLVGVLNNNTLRNSDFYTSAYPAEYIHVFSGTFDLNIRDGNNENYEFPGQVSFNVFELGTEGSFKKTRKPEVIRVFQKETKRPERKKQHRQSFQNKHFL